MAKEKLAPLSVKTKRVAGIDIGNSFHYVTVAPELTAENVRKFGTFTKELHTLGNWLVSLGITSVAMESTGVYWMGIYEILEEKGLEVLLVNARYPKQVSGRKTDVSDSAWIQQLHSYGLLPGSYIPANHTRVLRHYVRQRNSLAKTKATYLQRMGKSLQLMNVKLQNVVSKLETKVGMQIVRAIASGKHDAKGLAQFHTPQMKASKEELVLALQGNYRREYLFSLQQALSSYDFIQAQMEACELEIEKLLHTQQTGEMLDDSNESTSFQSLKKKRLVRQNDYHFEVSGYLEDIMGVDLLAVKGFSEKVLVDIISETGTDMSAWKTAKHFTSWLGLSPNPKISGDKVIGHKKTKNRGAAHQAFKKAAYSLHSSKGHLGDIYRRLSIRKNSAIAVQTVARKLAVIFYTMLKNKVPYQEQKSAEDQVRQREKARKRLEKQAKDLGYTLTPTLL